MLERSHPNPIRMDAFVRIAGYEQATQALESLIYDGVVFDDEDRYYLT